MIISIGIAFVALCVFAFGALELNEHYSKNNEPDYLFDCEEPVSRELQRCSHLDVDTSNWDISKVPTLKDLSAYKKAFSMCKNEYPPSINVEEIDIEKALSNCTPLGCIDVKKTKKQY